jgi:hypothetical protein
MYIDVRVPVMDRIRCLSTPQRPCDIAARCPSVYASKEAHNKRCTARMIKAKKKKSGEKRVEKREEVQDGKRGKAVERGPAFG